MPPPPRRVLYTVVGTLLCLLAAMPSAWALHPHQLGLIINSNNPDSVEIGVTYARSRGIPPSNIAFVPLPDADSTVHISPEAFKKQIWDPSWQQFASKGSQGNLLAWVYSTGFPTTVTSKPVTSIHGYTLGRLKIPANDGIRKGSAITPFFAGPTQPNGPKRNAMAFDRFPAFLRKQDPKAALPLPAMSLGYTGPRGLPTKAIRHHLEQQHSVTGESYTGSFVFIDHTGVRSKTRVWQFDGAMEELTALGHTCVRTSKLPDYALEVSGVMDGCSSIHSPYSNALPGGLGEHLTSFGATFATPSQSKISEWIEAGFGASSGTVVEPYAIWSKFPHARTHVFLAEGCSMIEALYQGTASPWETYFWGDPLVRPGKPSPPFTVRPVSHGDRSGIQVIPSSPSPALLVQPILDGRPLAAWSTDPLILWPKDSIPPGTRDLRVAVSTATAVGIGAYTEIPLAGNDPGPTVTGPASVRTGDDIALSIADPKGHRWEIETDALPRPKATDAAQVTLSAEDGIIPAGPLRLRAVRIDGKTKTPGPYIEVPVTLNNHLPEVDGAGTSETRSNTRRTLKLAVADPEGDAVQLSLYTPLAPFMPATDTNGVPVMNRLDDSVWIPISRLKNRQVNVSYVKPYPPLWGEWQEVLFDLRWETIPSKIATHEVYLLFNIEDGDHYDFVGFNGKRSAWVFGSRREGTDTFHVEQGHPQQLREWSTVSIRRADKGGLAVWIDAAPVCHWDQGKITNQRLGWRTATSHSRLRNPRLSTVLMSREVEGQVNAPAFFNAAWNIRLDDGRSTSWFVWNSPTDQ